MPRIGPWIAALGIGLAVEGGLQAVASGKPFAGVGGGEPPHTSACERLALGNVVNSSYEKRAHVRALPRCGFSLQGALQAVASGKPFAGVGGGKPPRSIVGMGRCIAIACG